MSDYRRNFLERDKVVVISEDPEFVHRVKQALPVEEGFEVVHVRDDIAAGISSADAVPSAFLVDFCSGRATFAVAGIRKTEATVQVPIIAVAGRRHHAKIDSARINAVIGKMFEAAELRNKLASAWSYIIDGELVSA